MSGYIKNTEARLSLSEKFASRLALRLRNPE